MRQDAPGRRQRARRPLTGSVGFGGPRRKGVRAPGRSGQLGRGRPRVQASLPRASARPSCCRLASQEAVDGRR